MRDDPQELRIALYSHDSLGLGHARRNLAIAQSLSRALPARTGRRVSGLLITGERTATSYRCPDGFDWVVIPGIRKATGRYGPRSLAVEAPRLFDIRSALVSGALTAFRPHIVIVDRHPFGAEGELIEPLRALRAAVPDVKLVLGLREVLDTPATARAEWDGVGVEAVAELFDRVWVYGDPAIHDPVATGELPERFAPMVTHTGLLSTGRRSSGRIHAVPEPFVITMLGGGSDGGALAETAAAAPVPEGYRHLVVTGPQMPAAQRARVSAAASERTTVTNKVSDGLSYVARAHALVAMAGYNTVAEALSTTTPALLIPRTAPRQEQLIRARAVGSTGAVDRLDPAYAGSAEIGAWLGRAVDDPELARRQNRARAELDLNGLERVADLAAQLAWYSDRHPVPQLAGPVVGAGATTAVACRTEVAHAAV